MKLRSLLGRLNTVQCLLLVCCASGADVSTGAPTREAELAEYLASAAHLSAEQRSLLERHQPFEGMTLEEATLAMVPLETEMAVGERVRQATFVGGGGVGYRVVFEGDPERVVDWVVADDVVLPKPDTYRPNPPISR